MRSPSDGDLKRWKILSLRKVIGKVNSEFIEMIARGSELRIWPGFGLVIFTTTLHLKNVVGGLPFSWSLYLDLENYGREKNLNSTHQQ